MTVLLDLLISQLILYSSMQFILYLMLVCNLLVGTVAYVNKDPLGVKHAAAFFLVALVALGLAWMSRREG